VVLGLVSLLVTAVATRTVLAVVRGNLLPPVTAERPDRVRAVA
jgi:hypothetical protein